MAETFEKIWAEIRKNLSKLPKCKKHPEYSCIETLNQAKPNDILEVSDNHIIVRSDETENSRTIEKSRFRKWWDALQKEGSVFIRPEKSPHRQDSRLVGAIFARCLARIAEYRDEDKKLWLKPESSSYMALPEELPAEHVYIEGAKRTIEINAYERDPNARAACIEHYGTTCAVCDWNLVDIYGDVAEGYIHIHHLKPLSLKRREYRVDPIKDLRPVCPNCHAIIHLKAPPYSIEEVQKFLESMQ